jgi:nicotinamide-nucleotide amidase
MIAEILSIGDELLNGTTPNTNAVWMADQLWRQGIQVRRIVTVGDNRDAIVAALQQASERSNVVLATGGLGPTRDDVTREAVAQFLGVQLAHRVDIEERLRERFLHRGADMPRSNLSQAYVPEGVEVLENVLGTAPGFYFCKQNCHFFVMPGVPAEMREMMQRYVLPFLERTFAADLPAIESLLVRTTGIFESRIADLLEPERQLDEYAVVAFLPHPWGVDIRLTAVASSRKEATERVRKALSILKSKLEPYIYEVGERRLEEVVGERLLNGGKTLAVAESCTGGLLGHLITSVPGSSNYFLGGVIAYSNDLKRQLLGVSQGELERHGAVSEPVARAMAIGVRERTGADYALSTTGIAGPGGGTPEKPVGLVYIALASADGTTVRRYVFHRDRRINKYRFAYAALHLLLSQLRAQKG